VRAGLRLAVWLVLSIVLAPSPVHGAKAIDGVVNLNTAPPEVLGLLPGVGPAKATEIVRYRTKRPFKTVDELVRIKGIGRKMVRRFRGHLAVAGPTTAAVAGPGYVEPPPPPPPKPATLCRMPVVKQATKKVRVVERWPSHGACRRPS